MAEFVHLHLHTEFSLLDGACRIEELLDEAVRLKMPALAVTEHGNMFSSVLFHDHARDRGINPILGCEVYVAPRSRFDKTGSQTETNHLVLLAENEEGYRNLTKLVSAGYTEGFYYRPRIDKDLLAEHSKGLIGLSSCLKGEVASALKIKQHKPALEAAARLRDILGPNNFFLEMQYQGLEEQKVVNQGILPLAKDLNLQLVCTNDVHYLRQGDHQPHDILLCIGTGKKVNDEGRLRYTGDQFFLKTADQMAEVFNETPQALRNTLLIAERCNVTIPKGESHLPSFEVPDGSSLDEYFEKIANEGFQERLPRLKKLASDGHLRHSVEEYEKRLMYEIEMIKRMGYPGYFLIVWDFIRYAREKGIPVGPGRGSAAGSLVAWCLRITDVDPLDFELIFERFLNPERVSLPDIDVDFCERRRGEVIDYVTQKYGRDNVAQIITFGKMKARAVVRDVGRALDISYAEVDRIAKQIPFALDMTLEKALAENPVLKEMDAKDPNVKKVLTIGRRLEGMSRHASVHAAGVVIAPGPITDYAPLYKSARDEITTQWTMNEIERVGLLKMDFLGLSTLTLIQDALREIKRTENIDLNIQTIPINDPKTYRLFCDGQTYGIFQFESSGMRDLLRKAKPERLEDLIALNALYRPGPLKSGMVDDFIARKQGKKAVKYELPELEPILADTYGVIAYQEQVMHISTKLAGFTLGQSDVLRKAMGKKDPGVMARQQELFVTGANKNGIDKRKAKKLFKLMENFAGYGFNKSHSTAYAFLAYQTAYLKANYPWHFASALLTIEAQDAKKLSTYLGECREREIPVLPPDLNESQLQFSVEPGRGVRFGLTAIKGLGEGVISEFITARQNLGRGITSIYELSEVVDLRHANKRVFEALVKSGACDSFYKKETQESTPEGVRHYRARLLASIDAVLDHGNRIQRDKDLGQADLFGEADSNEAGARQYKLTEASPLSELEQLQYEKETIGLYWSGHPIDRWADRLKTIGATTTADLALKQEALEEASLNGNVNGSNGTNKSAGRRESVGNISIGGIVSNIRPLKTRKGDRMCVMTLEDSHGFLEAVVFPEPFRIHSKLIEVGQTVLVKGKFEGAEDSLRMIATEIVPIETLLKGTAQSIAIHLSSPPHSKATFTKLLELFKQHKGDGSVTLSIDDHESNIRVYMDIDSQLRVHLSDSLVTKVKKLCGSESVTLN